MKFFPFIFVLALFAACSSNTEQTSTASKEPSAQQQQPQQAQQQAQQPQQAARPVKTNAPTANMPERGEGKIQWVSLEEAQKLNKKNPKKLLIDVYTNWCGPCKMMDRFTFSDEKVAEYVNENFYAVKFNGESADPVTFNGKTYENPNFRANVPANRRNAAHQITGAFGIRGYPTLVIYDKNLAKVKDIVGFRKPEQLMGELTKL
ncbi:MAG: thioredoxin fold domain-containing protein [Bacteroidota bacterium]